MADYTWSVKGATQAQRNAVAESLDDTRSWVDGRGYRLSDRLWSSKEADRKAIDTVLKRGLASGMSPLGIERALRQYLTPYGTQAQTRRPVGQKFDKDSGTWVDALSHKGNYAARRLARTELSRAYGNATLEAAMRNPWTKGCKWNLTGRHVEQDECDENAMANPDGLGPGVYNPKTFPRYPNHPNCLCYITKVATDIDDILKLAQQEAAAYNLAQQPAKPTSQGRGAATRQSARRPGPLNALQKIVHWQPEMNKEDAAKWAEDSEYKDDLFAATYGWGETGFDPQLGILQQEPMRLFRTQATAKKQKRGGIRHGEAVRFKPRKVLRINVDDMTRDGNPPSEIIIEELYDLIKTTGQSVGMASYDTTRTITGPTELIAAWQQIDNATRNDLIASLRLNMGRVALGEFLSSIGTDAIELYDSNGDSQIIVSPRAHEAFVFISESAVKARTEADARTEREEAKDVVWQPAMREQDAKWFAAKGAFPTRTFFHYTSEKAEKAIKSSGFLQTYGLLGTATYMTSSDIQGTGYLGGTATYSGKPLRVRTNVRNPFVIYSEVGDQRLGKGYFEAQVRRAYPDIGAKIDELRDKGVAVSFDRITRDFLAAKGHDAIVAYPGQNLELAPWLLTFDKNATVVVDNSAPIATVKEQTEFPESMPKPGDESIGFAQPQVEEADGQVVSNFVPSGDSFNNAWKFGESGKSWDKIHNAGEKADPAPVTGPARERWADAMNIVSQIHGLPKSNRRKKVTLWNDTNDTDARYGVYFSTDQAIAVKDRNHKIGEDYDTVFHELGHWLDYAVLPKGSQRRASDAKSRDGLMKPLMDAINSSPTIKQMRVDAKLKDANVKYTAYLLEDQELFARAYAQYIVSKMDKNSAPYQAFVSMRNVDKFTKTKRSWEDTEFETIAREFDKLFVALDMIKPGSLGAIAPSYEPMQGRKAPTTKPPSQFAGIAAEIRAAQAQGMVRPQQGSAIPEKLTAPKGKGEVYYVDRSALRGQQYEGVVTYGLKTNASTVPIGNGYKLDYFGALSPFEQSGIVAATKQQQEWQSGSLVPIRIDPGKVLVLPRNSGDPQILGKTLTSEWNKRFDPKSKPKLSGSSTPDGREMLRLMGYDAISLGSLNDPNHVLMFVPDARKYTLPKELTQPTGPSENPRSVPAPDDQRFVVSEAEAEMLTVASVIPFNDRRWFVSVPRDVKAISNALDNGLNEVPDGLQNNSRDADKMRIPGIPVSTSTWSGDSSVLLRVAINSQKFAQIEYSDGSEETAIEAWIQKAHPEHANWKDDFENAGALLRSLGYDGIYVANKNRDIPASMAVFDKSKIVIVGDEQGLRSYKPTMTKQEAIEWTGNSPVKDVQFYHHTAKEHVQSIRETGLRPSNGFYGRGVYATSDYTEDAASTTGAQGVDATLKLGVRGDNFLYVEHPIGGREISDIARKAQSEGYDGLVFEFGATQRNQQDQKWLLVFNPAQVTVVEDGDDEKTLPKSKGQQRAPLFPAPSSSWSPVKNYKEAMGWAGDNARDQTVLYTYLTKEQLLTAASGSGVPRVNGAYGEFIYAVNHSKAVDPKFQQAESELIRVPVVHKPRNPLDLRGRFMELTHATTFPGELEIWARRMKLDDDVATDTTKVLQHIADIGHDSVIVPLGADQSVTVALDPKTFVITEDPRDVFAPTNKSMTTVESLRDVIVSSVGIKDFSKASWRDLPSDGYQAVGRGQDVSIAQAKAIRSARDRVYYQVGENGKSALSFNLRGKLTAPSGLLSSYITNPDRVQAKDDAIEQNEGWGIDIFDPVVLKVDNPMVIPATDRQKHAFDVSREGLDGIRERLSEITDLMDEAVKKAPARSNPKQVAQDAINKWIKKTGYDSIEVQFSDTDSTMLIPLDGRQVMFLYERDADRKWYTTEPDGSAKTDQQQDNKTAWQILAESQLTNEQTELPGDESIGFAQPRKPVQLLSPIKAAQFTKGSQHTAPLWANLSDLELKGVMANEGNGPHSRGYSWLMTTTQRTAPMPDETAKEFYVKSTTPFLISRAKIDATDAVTDWKEKPDTGGTAAVRAIRRKAGDTVTLDPSTLVDITVAIDRILKDRYPDEYARIIEWQKKNFREDFKRLGERKLAQENVNLWREVLEMDGYDSIAIEHSSNQEIVIPLYLNQIAAPGPSDVEGWKPTMTPKEAMKWTENSILKDLQFYHHTSDAGAAGIKKEGLRPNSGWYGNGIYATDKASEQGASQTGARGMTKTLKLAINANNIKRIYAPTRSSIDPVAISETAQREGYDGLLLDFTGTSRNMIDHQWIVMFNQQNVTVVEDPDETDDIAVMPHRVPLRYGLPGEHTKSPVLNFADSMAFASDGRYREFVFYTYMSKEQLESFITSDRTSGVATATPGIFGNMVYSTTDPQLDPSTLIRTKERGLYRVPMRTRMKRPLDLRNQQVSATWASNPTDVLMDWAATQSDMDMLSDPISVVNAIRAKGYDGIMIPTSREMSVVLGFNESDFAITSDPGVALAPEIPTAYEPPLFAASEDPVVLEKVADKDWREGDYAAVRIGPSASIPNGRGQTRFFASIKPETAARIKTTRPGIYLTQQPEASASDTLISAIEDQQFEGQHTRYLPLDWTKYGRPFRGLIPLESDRHEVMDDQNTDGRVIVSTTNVLRIHMPQDTNVVGEWFSYGDDQTDIFKRALGQTFTPEQVELLIGGQRGDNQDPQEIKDMLEEWSQTTGYDAIEITFGNGGEPILLATNVKQLIEVDNSLLIETATAIEDQKAMDQVSDPTKTLDLSKTMVRSPTGFSGSEGAMNAKTAALIPSAEKRVWRNQSMDRNLALQQVAEGTPYLTHTTRTGPVYGAMVLDGELGRGATTMPRVFKSVIVSVQNPLVVSTGKFRPSPVDEAGMQEAFREAVTETMINAVEPQFREVTQNLANHMFDLQAPRADINAAIEAWRTATGHDAIEIRWDLGEPMLLVFDPGSIVPIQGDLIEEYRREVALAEEARSDKAQGIALPKFIGTDVASVIEEIVNQNNAPPSTASIEPSIPNSGSATPNGTPVSTALRAKQPAHANEYHQAVSNALDAATSAIDSVHGDGTLPNIDVQKMRSGGLLEAELVVNNGTIRYITVQSESTETGVKEVQDEARMTFALIHEIGHVLDYAALGPAGKFSSANPSPELKAVIDAIAGTDSYQKLARLATRQTASVTQDGSTTRYKIDQKFVAYLMSNRELFARAYAQYVVQSLPDGHPKKQALMGQLQRNITQGGGLYPSHWSEEEFAPVAEAMEILMRTKGWRV